MGKKITYLQSIIKNVFGQSSEKKDDSKNKNVISVKSFRNSITLFKRDNQNYKKIKRCSSYDMTRFIEI